MMVIKQTNVAMNPNQQQQASQQPLNQQHSQQVQQPTSQMMIGSNGPNNGDPVMHSAFIAPSMMPGQLPTHLMGMVGSPSMAAAAASSQLLPQTALIYNAGGFLNVPENFGIPAFGGRNASGQTGQMPTSLMMHSMPALFLAGGMETQGQATAGGQIGSLTNILPQGSMSMQAVAPNSTTSLDESEFDNGKRDKVSAVERVRMNRDRNREHARSTRLRKKAYVQKLKDLVEVLHAERTEELRERRVAVQHLAEVQDVRRAVVRSFLRFQVMYESDERKWSTVLEDDFWLKQPVTPFRSFRRVEIEKECRISRGVNAVICDAASLSVMIENIGSRASRWKQLKRAEFLYLEEAKRGTRKRPPCVVHQDSKIRHAMSSLSSSASNQSSTGEDEARRSKGTHPKDTGAKGAAINGSSDTFPGSANKVSSSSGSGSGSGYGSSSDCKPKDVYHDYNAQPLPDPKLADGEESSTFAEDYVEESNDTRETKRITTDSSSGDDSAAAQRPAKRNKIDCKALVADSTSAGEAACLGNQTPGLLPPNIARKGGIAHSIRSANQQSDDNGNARLRLAPAVALPPFAGIGKRSVPEPAFAAGLKEPSISEGSQGPTNEVVSGNGPAIIAADADTSSTDSSSKAPQIRCHYHTNEDDMILMDNTLMCPFIFRSQDAVLCGAFSECVMPGMLRARFSGRNKLTSLEMIYDAMGFMQHLERASGNEGMAQIVPGSLEMALSPTTSEARVITMAEPPFLIVNVNEVWTRLTGYTQMEVEGKEYHALLEGEGTVSVAKERPGRPRHLLEEVAKGSCACSTNIHYDKVGKDFIEFVCSYPLTNSNDKITHLLHVSKDLPSFPEASVSEQHVASSTGFDD